MVKHISGTLKAAEEIRARFLAPHDFSLEDESIVADLIEKHTRCGEMLKALELITDCVRRDRDARRDVKIYNGKLYKDAVQLRADFLTQAVDTAESLIDLTKGAE